MTHEFFSEGEGGSDSHLSWHCQIDSDAVPPSASLPYVPVSEICLLVLFGHAHRSTGNPQGRSGHLTLRSLAAQIYRVTH